MLGIYVAVSWVVFEVVQTLTEGLGLPDWVPPLAFVLLLIGLARNSAPAGVGDARVSIRAGSAQGVRRASKMQQRLARVIALIRESIEGGAQHN